YTRKDGTNAYTLAMRSGNAEAMRLLQEYGVTQEFGKPGDIYMMTVMTADRDEADAWLAEDPDAVRNLSGDAVDAFCDAAERGRADIVRIMLDHGWDPAMTDEWGRQPLHCAALRGFSAVVRMLLQAGAPLDHKDKLYGGTPMGWALHGALEMPSTTGDYLSVVEQIVAAGGLEFVNDREWCERDIAKVRERFGGSRS